MDEFPNPSEHRIVVGIDGPPRLEPIVPPPAPPEEPEEPPAPPPRKKRKKRRWLTILQWLFAMGTLGFLLAVVTVAAVISHYAKDLPSTAQLANYDPAVVTRLYSNDGRLMAEYAKEKRFFLPLSAIPQTVQHAFISAEDQDFYHNQGLDFWGIARAMRNNLLHAGGEHHLAGGSTITQQVVKNFLLTSEKSFERKVKEAVLAYRITKIYSKDKILELYLNQIYLGQGTYGVAAAAITYFDKSLDELSTEEAAMLAAMPKAPAYFDPAKNYKRALARRNYVIERMREDGYIDAREAARAEATPITTRPRDRDEVARADFFAEEVRRALVQMYGNNILYGGGLFVKTTLNRDFQDYADRALRQALIMYDQRHGYRGPIATLKDNMTGWQGGLQKILQDKNIPLFDDQQLAVVKRVGQKDADIGLLDGNPGTISLDSLSWARKELSTTMTGPAVTSVDQVLSVGDVILVQPVDGSRTAFTMFQIPQVNGAMVVMDPHTGKVLALSGGYAYYGGSEFDRATQAKRQPGSSFKPFVYLTALENGFSPTSIILDGPVSLPQGPGMPMWTPKNYEGDFLGPTTFRIGLEKSRNLMTVRIAQMIGIKRIKRVAKRFGIYDDDSIPENYSMVLGAYETTLLKLVNAYSMIANGGRRVSPWLIERIDDRNGTTIFRRDTRLCDQCVNVNAATANATPPTLEDERERVLDPRVAYQITSILEGVVIRGTGEAAHVLGRTGLAGKTGTTNDSRDTWFVGFTPDIVVGTYVGFDAPRSLGAKETGGRVAIQGFIKFMQQAGDKIEDKPFIAPPGIREIPIDRLSGQVLFAGQKSDGKSIINEAFLTGGPIFKPKNELDEELQNKDQEQAPALTPENVGSDESAPPPAPAAPGDAPVDAVAPLSTPPAGAPAQQPFTPPQAGQMAPYQRPVDPQGFNPNKDAGTGTGGLY